MCKPSNCWRPAIVILACKQRFSHEPLLAALAVQFTEILGVQAIINRWNAATLERPYTRLPQASGGQVGRLLQRLEMRFIPPRPLPNSYTTTDSFEMQCICQIRTIRNSTTWKLKRKTRNTIPLRRRLAAPIWRITSSHFDANIYSSHSDFFECARAR